MVDSYLQQGRLKKTKKLGEGAYGAVFLAVRRDHEGNLLDEPALAVKRIPLEAISQSERKATLREVQLLSQLRHPNIIRSAIRVRTALPSYLHLHSLSQR